MRRYLRVYRSFIASSLARELEFRANFMAKIMQNVVWMGFSLLVILVIFRNTNSVAGWSRDEVFVLGATGFLMNAGFSAFFSPLMEIPQQVRMGTLDYVVTKPIDTQFWVSTRRFGFEQIGTGLAGIAILILGLAQSTSPPPDAAQWFGYCVLLVVALSLFYSFMFVLMTLGIYFVRVDNLWVLGETAMGIARYPLDIYARTIRQFMTFVVPLAFIATIPTRQLTERFDGQMVLLGLLWMVVGLAFARWFWRFSLIRYSSASS